LILPQRIGGGAEKANKILELFYQKPALNVKEIEKSLSINQRTIRNVLNALENEILMGNTADQLGDGRLAIEHK